MRKSAHMDALRRALVERRSATRAQLAEATGLSTMTIGKLLAELEARGEVRQDETAASGGGRPSLIAAYDGSCAYAAVITVTQSQGGNAFVFGVYDVFGCCVMRREQVLGCVRTDSFDAWIEEALSLGYRLRLIALALPGEADGDDIFICDFPALLHSDLLPRLRARYGLETLFENDVNAAVLGHDFGAEAPDVRAGMYFPRRYAPGAGVVIGREVLRGSRHFAGEISAIHGRERWLALDYGDTPRVLGMIGDLLLVYACTAAPGGMVLYGDFFTPEMEEALAQAVHERLRGQFSWKLVCCRDMAQDMQCGAAALAAAQMMMILGRED